MHTDPSRQLLRHRILQFPSGAQLARKQNCNLEKITQTANKGSRNVMRIEGAAVAPDCAGRFELESEAMDRELPTTWN